MLDIQKAIAPPYDSGGSGAPLHGNRRMIHAQHIVCKIAVGGGDRKTQSDDRRAPTQPPTTGDVFRQPPRASRALGRSRRSS